MKMQQIDPAVAVKSRYHLWITLTIALFFAGYWNNASASGCLDTLWAYLFSDTSGIAYNLDDSDVMYGLDDNDNNALTDNVAITIINQPQQPAQPKGKPLNIADTSGVIISNLDGHLFFTTPRPCKTLRSEGENIFIALSLKLLESKPVQSWYANNCSNPTLVKLIDVTINCIETCEQDLEKVASKVPQATLGIMANVKTKTTVKKPNLAIFDIDATIVSAYKAECIISQNWAGLSEDAINELLIKAVTDIAPVHHLYTYFKRKGYSIAFISGRTESTREDTTEILQKNGYTVNGKNLFLRRKPSDDMTKFKAAVREKLAATYAIFAIVDDDYRNLGRTYRGRYNIWIPNILKAQNGEAAFYAYLTQNPAFPDMQPHTKFV